MWLMRKKRNNPLEEKSQASQQSSYICEEYPNQLAIWLERKDTSISAIYESVLKVPNALELVELDMLEKEILPAADPQKDLWHVIC